MWYWIIAGSIFLFLEVIVLLILIPLKDKYEFIGYTINALSIALFFPLVIVFIISSFIVLNLKKKNKKEN
jgi:hypothetical protein